VTAVTLTVLKCGGAFLARSRFVVGDHVDDASVCVVHGAGARINRALARAGIESTFVDGRRVTSDAALPIVRDAFARENRELCRQIGARAVGLLGDELGLEAQRLPGFGHAGTLLPVVPEPLHDLLQTDAVPVVASLARGPLNVNADDAAAVLSVALHADRLLFVSDVPGVIVDGEVVPVLTERDITWLRGEVDGGMVPKLHAALVAAREGVEVGIGRTSVVA
jgi:acetylglutamate kinase